MQYCEAEWNFMLRRKSSFMRLLSRYILSIYGWWPFQYSFNTPVDLNAYWWYIGHCTHLQGTQIPLSGPFSTIIERFLGVLQEGRVEIKERESWRSMSNRLTLTKYKSSHLEWKRKNPFGPEFYVMAPRRMTLELTWAKSTETFKQ